MIAVIVSKPNATTSPHACVKAPSALPLMMELDTRNRCIKIAQLAKKLNINKD
jgi:hypothetical protein